MSIWSPFLSPLVGLTSWWNPKLQLFISRLWHVVQTICAYSTEKWKMGKQTVYLGTMDRLFTVKHNIIPKKFGFPQRFLHHNMSCQSSSPEQQRYGTENFNLSSCFSNNLQLEIVKSQLDSCVNVKISVAHNFGLSGSFLLIFVEFKLVQKMPHKRMYYPDYHLVEERNSSKSNWRLFKISVCIPGTYHRAVEKGITHFPCQHLHLPITPISDNKSTIASQIIIEFAAILWSILKHATTKHAKSIGILQNTHASINLHLQWVISEISGTNFPCSNLLQHTTYLMQVWAFKQQGYSAAEHHTTTWTAINPLVFSHVFGQTLMLPKKFNETEHSMIR